MCSEAIDFTVLETIASNITSLDELDYMLRENSSCMQPLEHMYNHGGGGGGGAAILSANWLE